MRFSEHLDAIKEAGFRSITLDDWIGARSRPNSLPVKPVILTFDDGYRDFLTAALPALRAHSLTATVFVVADCVGGVAGWDAEYGEAAPLMSWQELRQLAPAGIDVGCHSSSHRAMIELDPTDLTRDLRHAREVLELNLSQSIAHSAYPYGAENPLVRTIVAATGFLTAAGCRAVLQLCSRVGGRDSDERFNSLQRTDQE